MKGFQDLEQPPIAGPGGLLHGIFWKSPAQRSSEGHGKPHVSRSYERVDILPCREGILGLFGLAVCFQMCTRRERTLYFESCGLETLLETGVNCA